MGGVNLRLLNALISADAFAWPGVCVVCSGQYSASMGSTVTRSFTAWASCRSSVINASAWSWGQGDVLGVKGVRPAEQAGGLPCDILEDAVSEQPHPQPSHIFELPLGLLPGHLTAADCLIQE